MALPAVGVGSQSSPNGDESRWYVVHALPHREFGAANQLRFQNFETFLPVHLKTVRHARQFRTVKAAFFPRYLFVRLNLARDRWRSVNSTFGVSRLIMEGEVPKPVPLGIVEELAAITDREGLLSFAQRMQPGERVRILQGPFADHIGKLIDVDERSRVRILLEVMGFPVVVHTSGEQLAPVS